MTALAGNGVVDPLSIPDWDARLDHFPAATFFHTAAWARVLRATYRFNPLYFVQSRREKWTALLAVMEVNSWLTGRRGVSLPFTDECEPLCADPESFQEAWRGVLDHAKARSWKYFECRGGRESLPGSSAATSFWGHRLDLRDGPVALFDRTEGAVRQAVRKAEKGGLTIEFSQGIESMRIFYRLLCQTRKRHGLPPQPFSFFANIQQHALAKDHGWTILARHGGTPVAGAVFLHFGPKAVYKFGASDEEFQSMRPNNLVMWEAIKRCIAEGRAVLDFGRTSLANHGLRRFKLAWGSEERRIDYVRYDLHAGRYVAVADQAAGWHTRAIRNLPTFLSRLIGAMLYKHIA